MEDSSNPKREQKELLERLRKSSFPPAAVAAAFASFVNAAMGRAQPKSSPDRSGSPAFVQISLAESKPAGTSVKLSLGFEYSQTSALPKFSRSLAGIAVGPADNVYALGDGEVRIFRHDGTFVRSWKIPEQAACLAVGRDERVYIGASGRVEVFDSTGNHKEGFDTGDAGRTGNITSIKATTREVLVADAAARCIRRYDFNGRRLGEIGTQNKTGGFMLPNRSLDIDVDSKGAVLASDPGRHRVTLWSLEGTPVRHFGKFGLMNPEDFVGCCNPVNVAFAQDGRILTAEKVIPRVKVFDSAGKLLALIGPEHFDAKCIHLHLAVDSKGRILVADPVRLEVKIFTVVVKPGGRENV